jgi:hypothetical protein
MAGRGDALSYSVLRLYVTVMGGRRGCRYREDHVERGAERHNRREGRLPAGRHARRRRSRCGQNNQVAGRG